MLGRVPQILKVKPDQPEPELQTYGYPNTFNNLQKTLKIQNFAKICSGNLYFYSNQSVFKPNHIEMAFNYAQFWLFQVRPIAQFKPKHDKPENRNFKSETR